MAKLAFYYCRTQQRYSFVILCSIPSYRWGKSLSFPDLLVFFLDSIFCGKNVFSSYPIFSSCSCFILLCFGAFPFLNFLHTTFSSLILRSWMFAASFQVLLSRILPPHFCPSVSLAIFLNVLSACSLFDYFSSI